MTRPASTRGLVYTTSTFSKSTIAGKDTCFIPKSKNRSNQQDRDELRLGTRGGCDRPDQSALGPPLGSHPCVALSCARAGGQRSGAGGKFPPKAQVNEVIDNDVAD
jgi:hypothetical protein